MLSFMIFVRYFYYEEVTFTPNSRSRPTVIIVFISLIQFYKVKIIRWVIC